MKPLKILSRIGIVLLVVVAAVLVVRAVLNYTEGRALARTLAVLKAQGIPVTAKDLASPCPDEDNGARLWKAIESITTIPGRKSGPPAPGQRPPRPSAAAQTSLSKAWQDHAEGRPIAPADRAALKELIRENDKSFGLLAEMVDKPCFLYRDPAESLVESLTPRALLTLQTSRLLAFSSLFSAEDGDVRGAVDKLVLGLKFAPLMAREGTLISFLVSLAETRTASQILGDVCRGRAVAGDDLERLMALQDPGPWRERVVAAVRGERVMFIEVGNYLLKGSLNDLGSIWEGPHWWQQLGLWLARPLVKRDLRENLPDFDFLEAQAKVPYYQCREALGARDRDLELKKRPWYAFLSKMMISGSEAAFMKEAMIESIMSANRTGLACRLYKSRTGRYPERLEELVPALLPEVPIDPFTGKTLVYRREGEGFIVYSLGSNQRDDGGRMTYAISRLVTYKDDDWSWKEDK
jgi:hypothetical protein